ncbi:MAG: ABC transporter substrate-binding protein [Pseudanabaenaceae cyanobacterium]
MASLQLWNSSKLTRTFTLAWLAVATTLGQTAVVADNSLSRVLRQNRLQVGVDARIGAPYLFWNSRTRYLDGFEWEIARELAAQLKVDIRPVQIPWTNQPDQLRQRQIDIIISVREQGSLDANLFAESQPYYRSSQRILVRRDLGNVNNLRGLIGKRVGVLPNSGGAALVETYNKNRGNAVRVFSSPDLDRMVQQLLNRQLDALILDEPVAVWQAQQRPQLQIVGRPALAINLVVVLNKEDVSLRQAIDRALTELQQNGKLEQILRRWQLWQSQQFSR